MEHLQMTIALNNWFKKEFTLNAWQIGPKIYRLYIECGA